MGDSAHPAYAGETGFYRKDHMRGEFAVVEHGTKHTAPETTVVLLSEDGTTKVVLKSASAGEPFNLGTIWWVFDIQVFDPKLQQTGADREHALDR